LSKNRVTKLIGKEKKANVDKKDTSNTQKKKGGNVKEKKIEGDKKIEGKEKEKNKEPEKKIDKKTKNKKNLDKDKKTDIQIPNNLNVEKESFPSDLTPLYDNDIYEEEDKGTLANKFIPTKNIGVFEDGWEEGKEEKTLLVLSELTDVDFKSQSSNKFIHRSNPSNSGGKANNLSSLGLSNSNHLAICICEEPVDECGGSSWGKIGMENESDGKVWWKRWVEDDKVVDNELDGVKREIISDKEDIENGDDGNESKKRSLGVSGDCICFFVYMLLPYVTDVEKKFDNNNILSPFPTPSSLSPNPGSVSPLPAFGSSKPALNVAPYCLCSLGTLLFDPVLITSRLHNKWFALHSQSSDEEKNLSKKSSSMHLLVLYLSYITKIPYENLVVGHYTTEANVIFLFINFYIFFFIIGSNCIYFVFFFFFF
jgi:hypothetical protein